MKPDKNGRRRDSDGNICEWDYRHNDIEVYKDKGKKLPHLGSKDPVTGKFYKPAVSGRTIMK